MKGFPTDDGHRPPRVELVSIYLDQIDSRDIGVGLAEEAQSADISEYSASIDTW